MSQINYPEDLPNEDDDIDELLEKESNLPDPEPLD